MLKIYHNNRCRKSREAKAYLEEQGVDFEVIEYLQSPPTIEELEKVLSLLKLEPEDILRKSESVFKEKYKGKNFSRDQWLNILHKEPKLIERPIVFSENSGVVARPIDKLVDFMGN